MTQHKNDFDLHRHLASGGTVTVVWNPGTPDHVIDARFDAVVEGDLPGYIATACDASGQEVAYGAAMCNEKEEDFTPMRAMERLRLPYRRVEEPLDPNCPF